jgi:hypothetical protein
LIGLQHVFRRFTDEPQTTEAEIEVHFPLRLWSQIDRFAGVDVFVWRFVAFLWRLMAFEPGRECIDGLCVALRVILMESVDLLSLSGIFA